MANTTDLRLSDREWVLVATNPDAITIKSNQSSDWHIAIKDTAGAPAASLAGEIHRGEATWEGGVIVGSVYIRGRAGNLFAITLQGGV